MAVKVTLTIPNLISLWNSVEIHLGSGFSIRETCRDARSGANTFKQGVYRVEVAQNLASAIQTDYNSVYDVTATSAGERVIIDIPNEQNVISVSGGAVSSGEVLYSIELIEEPVEPDPTDPTDPEEGLGTVTLQGFMAGGNPCTHLNAEIAITGGTPPYRTEQQTMPMQSPLSVGGQRGQSKHVRIVDSYNSFIGEITIDFPRKQVIGDFNLQVSQNDEGSTLVVGSTGYVVGPLTYSINGETYQGSNTFPDLQQGTYTLYIRDRYGCVLQMPFFVDGSTRLVETIFSISDINALRFAKVQPEAKKNHINTLSCTQLKQVAYPFFHRYTNEDVVTTQFKTNAPYIDAHTLDARGQKIQLQVSKKSNNIGKRTKSTCTVFQVKEGILGVFFGLVEILDPDTDAFIEYIDYGFNVPGWAQQQHQKVSISGLGTAPISRVVYSSRFAGYVLELPISYTGGEEQRTLSATYNIQPYEVYEFDLPMSAQPDMFQVVLNAGTGASDVKHSFLSEKIKKVADSDRLFEISYHHDSNRGGMVYRTGIRHKLRLEGMVDYVGEQETEGYNGDTEYWPTDNLIYRSERFVFKNLSTEMAHKLRLAMAHEHLTINGVNYKLAEEPEIEGSPTQNLRTFSVVLKPGGELFLDSDFEMIPVPAQPGDPENPTNPTDPTNPTSTYVMDGYVEPGYVV